LIKLPVTAAAMLCQKAAYQLDKIHAANRTKPDGQASQKNAPVFSARHLSLDIKKAPAGAFNFEEI